MTQIIKVHGLGDGATFTEPLWLERYDVNAPPDAQRASYRIRDGMIINGAFGGRIILTTDREAAMTFESTADAMTAWNTPSTRWPLRPDGRPNKPLTALTVEIEPQ